ncbi:MAG: tRNA-dihydrouridine synthase [Candidatus Nomurabacteria bacterium GW2011_GWF2_35_12]|uniref:tRNA-dihydrouridine synthase n=3 Tax=Candidatus Nomuraibacteriota TaxID=1752729 RepID=A0A0G0DSM1_9BACT|nr:MAG: tRNA-dihydrouridine synthase [Candidatus Nomurabacteria bacterium GW2011_GWF2_35_12]KKP72054.1 MAG: tRNA-dihydrouridine synthase [Candidatus Nomurabacteria bacterium GW2011_GWB1_35_20]KKP76455.1 MAG: hypothetical protein UR72_C0002G0101 [Parcubacteria group bacterium GW2011_GWC1_35_21]KKP78152.1 MAG: tRNA-dihydrouridine synthase [Candidatus Nomurabacteria bacterium GW2011_GWC2_35_35]KKP85466.1 MAG: tRNA-dihydrouridine synthase [Parcubacteria group bacterium GW2011_GWD2_35_7]KKP88469.1 
MNNFWKKLNKPFFCLAPMSDVTDCAFRQIIAKYGKPDVFWTEFVSADGLAHSKAQKKLLIDLKFSKKEHPIVAQLFGSNVENMKKASALCGKLGFDGIDINMGCPDKSVEKQNSGAAMIKNPELARKIIRATCEGSNGLPISVKTRIGYNSPPPKSFGRASKNKNYLLDEKWIRSLLEENLAALVVHLRTRKEMSNVPAHWDLMKRIVEIRDEINKKTLIIGNGDVLDLEEAKQKIKETGCDGVMLGRAIFGNPWLFAKRSPLKFKNYVIKKLKVLIEHTKLFEKLLGKYKNFAVMKKHYKTYVKDFEGAKELRTKLMETKNAKEVEKIVKDFLLFLKEI